MALFGLDYVTGPPTGALLAAGVSFVCRYLSEVNDLTREKLLTPAEARALSAAGLSIVSNFEWYGTRASEGVAAGIQDARTAAAQHADCGGPPARPIYFSVDFDMTASEEAAVAAYFTGVASVVGTGRTGAYGSYGTLKSLFDAGLIAWGWQTYAWSGGLWEPRAHLQQYENGVQLAGYSVDYNRATVADFGQWRVGGAAPALATDQQQQQEGGGIPVQLYSSASRDFATWFTAQDADHWLCRQTDVVIHDAILHAYQTLSVDGQTLPVVGLPTRPERIVPVTRKDGTTAQVVLMECERACLGYDPAHVKDSQPGMGDVYLVKLTDPDVQALLRGAPASAPPPAPPPPPGAGVSTQVAADIRTLLADAQKLAHDSGLD